MNRKNPFMLIFAVIVVASMILAACGAPATPAPQEVKPPVATEAKPAPTTAPQQPAQPAQAPGTPGACPQATVADMKGIAPGAFPQQYELAEFEKLANCKLNFASRAKFDPVVEKLFNKPLPPLEQRLPEEPLVVVPYASIGTYGGLMRGLSIGPESGNSEWLSVRHVNLLRFLDDLKTIVPNVAKSYEVNKDYTEFTFTLRKGHKWSDGEPFTTDDVLFWYNDIILNKDLTPTVPSYWVFGGEPMTMEKVDDQTFKIKTIAPAPGLLIWFAKTWIQPWAPKHFLMDKHLKYNPNVEADAKAAGKADWKEYFYMFHGDWQDAVHVLGVPKLESHVMIQETTEFQLFAANPFYFKVDTAGNQLPYIDQLHQSYATDKEVIELKVISGEVDQKSQSLDFSSVPLYKQHEADGKYTLILTPPEGMGANYGFNCTDKDPVLRKLFSDPRWNQAMSLALDRAEFNKVLCFGQCQPMQALPIVPQVSFAKPEWFTYNIEYNPDKANQILDELGLKKGPDGFRLRPDGKKLIIFINYPVQAGDPAAHALAKEYWEKVGVQVQLKQVDTEAYRAMATNNDHDVAVMNSGEESEPSIIANQQRFIPPFGDPALEPICGQSYLDWYNTKGAKGEEPPADIKTLFDLTQKFRTAIPGTEEYKTLGQQIFDIHSRNMYLIGTISASPAVGVVSTRLQNIPPKINMWAWAYYRTYPFRTDQWFFKE